MGDIAAFLTARLDEDEAAAKAAGVGMRDTWHVTSWYDGQFEGRNTVSVDIHGLAGAPITSRGVLLRQDGEHIARHDPARVLREVAAKRAIIKDYSITCRIRDEAAARIQDARASGLIVHADYSEWERANREASILDGVVLHLAAVYADHPDYQEGWKP